ncbi:MAG: transcriptional regulator [Actinomycetota bacterium]|nr:transcriptional regulator [Actinomycetota bacterium]
MTQVDRRTHHPLTPSQQEWLRVRAYMREHRYDLSIAAAKEYPDVAKVARTALLATSRWLPAEPIPFDRVGLDLTLDVPFSGVTGTEQATENVRPLRSDHTRYPSYSAAIADLSAPAVFENRRTYRLLGADLVGARPRLVYGRGRYFDGIDVGEAVGHEYAARRFSGEGEGIFRASIGSPVDPARRPTNVAISTLTIRHDRSNGDARFLLHWRDPARVGHAGGLYQVLPVGIFQPANDHPGSERNDFDLWRCLVREFAEELLGETEVNGHSGPIDYSDWPFAARMSRGLHDGSIRPYCLAMGVDPLTLATDLLAVVVMEASVFDEIFGSLVDSNDEGQIVSPSAKFPGGLPGFPLMKSEVERLTRREPMQAAGAAAIASAWLHRDQLLS